MKPPPQFADDEAHHLLESYIASHALPSRKATQRRETVGAGQAYRDV